MEMFKDLKPGARLLWEAALQVPGRYGHQEPGLNHLLLALMERHGKMAEALASGLKADDYQNQIRKQVETGEIGEPVEPEALLKAAQIRANSVGKAQVSERDLAAILLERAGWTLFAEPRSTASVESRSRDPKDMGPLAATTAGEDVPAGDYRPRARLPTPFLEEFGRDLCREAQAGKLPTILGRQLELQLIMETLCRWTKRNPLLVGPAGVGKTAIVQGLAQRVVQGEVPPPIQGIRIFSVQASSLVSGASVVGKLEQRMHTLLEEASQDGIVLFIDEVHTIVGSGGMRQISDIGSLLKPALAKGEIACIGATTDAEYHQFIEQDRALERRFQPLRVQELSSEATLEILHVLKARAERDRSVTFSDEALELIILLAQQYLRNRYFPDKGIDIFEQSTAHAVVNGIGEVTPDLVRTVTERMVGMPVDLGVGLSRNLNDLKARLIAEAFCPEPVASQIIRRLEVTMRGLDVAPGRPNVVLLVAGVTGDVPELTARVLSRSLYGDQTRLIELDMTRFTHPSDVNWLIGAPPGYVGHDNVMSFHLELSQQPWSVILFKNAEASHVQAQEVLAQAFRSGFLTDARGRKVYLSDAAVILTVTTEERAERSLGFAPRKADADAASELDPGVTSLLAPDLLSEVDLSWRVELPTAEQVQTWVKQGLLPGVAERYERQGLQMEWDPSLLEWLSQAVLASGDLTEAERLLEERVLPELVPHLHKPGRFVLSYKEDGDVHIRARDRE